MEPKQLSHIGFWEPGVEALFRRECGFRVTVIREEPGYRTAVNLNE
ncbi:hypothetical protein ACVIJ6_005838 [Bradyrhizobium sp. USDA 4369]